MSVVEKLLDSGATINKQDSRGYTVSVTLVVTSHLCQAS